MCLPLITGLHCLPEDARLRDVVGRAQTREKSIVT